jgi:hypothetical protein
MTSSDYPDELSLLCQQLGDESLALDCRNEHTSVSGDDFMIFLL